MTKTKEQEGYISKSRSRQLITFSAKTKSELNEITKKIAEYLKKNSDINLADVAYTLQVNRKASKYRRMTTGSNAKEIAAALSSLDPRKVQSAIAQENRKVVFMFSGLGSQYVDMGLELYQEEPVFFKELNTCFDLLNGLLDYDLKCILYPNRNVKSTPVPYPLGPGEDPMNQIEIAQLIIFVFEYGLAKLLMNWGITPDAMIGYSFGEYIAACLSGIFSLEDALKLVVLRGKLLRQVHKGGMLSVPLPQDKLKPLLKDELSLAIDNGPSCVVAGPAKAIDDFETQMKTKGYLSMRIQTSHALHSRMMEPILKMFEMEVSKVPRNPSNIPFISNVTGNWITPGEAASPTYWATHLRSTVQFDKGINLLLEEPHCLFIEIGPGRDLSSLVSYHFKKESHHKAFNLVPPAQKKISDLYYLLVRIGQMWLYGIKIDWSKFHHNEKRPRTPLSIHPF